MKTEMIQLIKTPHTCKDYGSNKTAHQIGSLPDKKKTRIRINLKLNRGWQTFFLSPTPGWLQAGENIMILLSFITDFTIQHKHSQTF